MSDLEDLISIPVAPRLSPATHPGVVRKFDGEDDLSVSLRRNLASALDGLYRWSAVFDATLEAANADARYGIRAAKLKQIAPAYQGAEGPTIVTDAESHVLRHATPAFDRAFAKGQEYAKKLDYLRELAVKRVEDGITTETGLGTIESQEVRSHCKALNDLDRMKFIHELQKAGDRSSLLALLRGKAYLSGITEKEVASIRRFLFPDEHRAIDRVEEAATYYTTAVNQARDRFDRMKERVEKLPGAKAFREFGTIK